MDANEIASAVRRQVQSILTEKLRNYFNEAKLAIEAIEKEEGIKINGCDKLFVILKSLKDIPRKMAVELIRNSSLNDRDKSLLNILYGNPRVAILLTDKNDKEEVYDGELIPSGKQIVRQDFPEWPRDDVNEEEEEED